MPNVRGQPRAMATGRIANVQFQIQIVDTHEALKTRVDTGSKPVDLK